MSLPAGAPAESVRLPVVMYHSITKINNNDYVLSPEKFEADVRYLSENGYRSVFLSEVADFVDGKGQLPKKPVVLSFDDGFYNNKANVLPILQKYGFKASFMVVGEYSQREEGETIRSTVYSYLSYDDVREMLNSGLCEFGNHTYHMHTLKNGRKGVQRKKGESESAYRKAFIEDTKRNEAAYARCGVTFSAYAYPYGCYSGETPKILRELGYRTVLTCNSGMNVVKRGDANYLMALKRWNRPSKYSTKEFFEKICKL